VKQLALYHHDPLHDDTFVDGMVRDANKIAKGFDGQTDCVGAREGMEIVLP
jgi:hypothetical protein